MPALSIQPTYPIFTDIDGQPLENGYVWIGTANLDPQTNPINVYWDDALTQLAAQPIRTRGGYPVNAGTPSRLYVNSDYSIRVTNKNGAAIYNAPEATERYSSAIISQIDSSLVNYTPAGTGAVTTTVQNKLRETVSVKDFGAVGDGSTNDTQAIQNALDYASTSKIYYVDCSGASVGYAVTNITIPAHVTLDGGGGARGSTLIDGTASGNVVTLGNNACIKNCLIYGVSTGTTPSVGIYANGTEPAIENCTVRFTNDQGILFGSSSIAGHLKDVFVYNAVMNTTRAAVTGAVEIDGTDHYLSNVEAGCSLSAKSSASFYLAGVYIKGADCFLVNTHGENSDVGIYLGGSNGRSRLVNCRGDLSFSHGFYISSFGNMLSSCLAYNNSRDVANTYSGFYVTNSGNTFAACNNRNISGSTKYGFEDTTSGNNANQRNSYYGCMSNGHATKAYSTADYLGAALQPINSTIRYTSGTSWDVDQVSNVWLGYASPTTVTAINNGINGQTIRVIGDGQVTLQYTSNIKTNTGANKLLAAEKVYTFTNIFAVWYENE